MSTKKGSEIVSGIAFKMSKQKQPLNKSLHLASS